MASSFIAMACMAAYIVFYTIKRRLYAELAVSGVMLVSATAVLIVTNFFVNDSGILSTVLQALNIG